MTDYLYIVDLDEGGYFEAHIEESESGYERFTFTNDDTEDGSLWLIEDGWIKGIDDVSGLLEYLIKMDIVEENATLRLCDNSNKTLHLNFV